MRLFPFAVVLALSASLTAQTAPPPPIEWTLDILTRIGGYQVTVVGHPQVVDTPVGRAIEFDGVGDGVFVEGNPIDGLDRFRIDVLFQPAADGLEEQRFLHVEEPGSMNRALIELRHVPSGAWALDTYLRYGDAQLTLL